MPANMKRPACSSKRFAVLRQRVVNKKRVSRCCGKARESKALAVGARRSSGPVTPCARAVRCLLDAIRGSDLISRDLKRTMRALAKASVKAKRGGLSVADVEGCHFVQDEAVRELQHMLDDIEHKLNEEVRAKQAVVNGASADKVAREMALVAATSRLAELRGAVRELTAASKATQKAVVEAQGTVERAVQAHNACKEELKSLHTKKAKLESIEKTTVVPLQLSQIKGGSAGQKRLKILQKAGKHYGFHDVLLSSLPLIFKKHPDRRVTFDGLAMQSLNNEFQKRNAAFDLEIGTVEARLEEQAITEERAKSALALADERLKASGRACSDAELTAKAGVETLAESKKRVQLFSKDRSDSLRALKKAQMKLHKFQRGPLASFVKLKAALPVGLPVVATESSASEDRDTDTQMDANSSAPKQRRPIEQ